MVKRLKNESYKKSMKESYGDINDDNVWEVFDYVKELLTPDGLVENMARWMGLDDLTKCMQYICRTHDINVLEDGMYESVNINESNNPGTIVPKAKAWVKELEKTFKYLSKKYGDDISDIEEAFIDLFDNSGDEIIPWEWDMLIIGAFKEDYESMKEEESDTDEDEE